jgi:hypothetical protein
MYLCSRTAANVSWKSGLILIVVRLKASYNKVVGFRLVDFYYSSVYTGKVINFSDLLRSSFAYAMISLQGKVLSGLVQHNSFCVFSCFDCFDTNYKHFSTREVHK